MPGGGCVRVGRLLVRIGEPEAATGPAPLELHHVIRFGPRHAIRTEAANVHAGAEPSTELAASPNSVPVEPAIVGREERSRPHDVPGPERHTLLVFADARDD